MKGLILVLILISISQVYAQDYGRYPAYEDAEFRSEQMELELNVRDLKRENKRLREEVKELKKESEEKLAVKN